MQQSLKVVEQPYGPGKFNICPIDRFVFELNRFL